MGRAREREGRAGLKKPSGLAASHLLHFRLPNPHPVHKQIPASSPQTSLPLSSSSTSRCSSIPSRSNLCFSSQFFVLLPLPPFQVSSCSFIPIHPRIITKMKSVAAALALFAGLSIAQDLSQLGNLPQCGVSEG